MEAIAFGRRTAKTRGRCSWGNGLSGWRPNRILESPFPFPRSRTMGHERRRLESPQNCRIHLAGQHDIPARMVSERAPSCLHRKRDSSLGYHATLLDLDTECGRGGDLQGVVRDSRLGTGLAWATDSRIFFASRADHAGARDDEGVRSIRVDKRTGGGIGTSQVVTDGEGSIGRMSISADGKRLILCRTNRAMQAFVSELDSSARKWKTPRRLTLDDNVNLAYTWMPDGKTVVFASNRNGKWLLFRQALADTTAEVLVEGDHVSLPRLSADGTQVLYQLRNAEHPSQAISLMRLPVAGGPPQLVLQEVNLGNHQCARLPSTLCLFNKDEGRNFVFVSFDPMHGGVHEVLRSEVPGNWSLSPDGKTLALFPGDHSIRFYSLENGSAHEGRPIELNDWWIQNGDWSADGKSLLIPSFTAVGEPVILQVDQTGKASIVLKEAGNSGFGFMVQAPDGKHALVGEEVPGDSNVWMIDRF